MNNTGNANTDEEAIKAVLNQYEVTLNNGDFDSWISLWTDNGVQLPPNTPLRTGKAKITEKSKPTFDKMYFDIKITSIDEVRVFGNIGLTTCQYHVTLTPKDGGEKIIGEPDGKALTLYEKQPDGTWKISYDCFNSNVPPQVK